MGYWPNKNWDDFIDPEEFEIIKAERKMNDTIYFYILRNLK